MPLVTLPSPTELIQYRRLREVWRDAPVLYARQRFGVEPTWQQVAILESLAPYGAKVTVRSGHGMGKTSAAAFSLFWHLETHDYSKVPCTAPSAHQLRDILWGELSKWRRLADEQSQSHGIAPCFWLSNLFRLTQDRLFDTTAPEWGAVARTASKENPEALQGFHADHLLFIIDEACFDRQTEILTDQGWRFFSQLDGTEQMLTMDPETGLAFYARPTKYIRYPYQGPMYHFSHRTLDFCVTPTHRFWYRYRHRARPGYGTTSMKYQAIQDIRSDEFFLPRAVQRKVLDVASFVLPSVRNRYKQSLAPLAIAMDTWATFLGWYFAEGSLGGKIGGKPYTVWISQHNPAGRALLRVLLTYLPFPMQEYPTGFAINSWRLAGLLQAYGEGFSGKEIPRYLMAISPRQQRLFLDAYLAGDGYLRANGRRIYYTSSQHLANGLQEMIILSGGYASCHTRSMEGMRTWIKDHYALSSCDGYVVAEYTRPTFARVNRGQMQMIPYDDDVYCVTVPPHHLIYVRRHGTCYWSGNSAVPESIFEAAEGALTGAGARVLLLGNPTRTSGTFHASHVHNRGQYTALHFRSQDSPLVAPGYRDGLVRKWGEGSNVVRVRADGEFPRQEDDVLISLELTEPCLTREVCAGDGPRRLGVDVAWKGADRTTLVLRQGNVVDQIAIFAKDDTMVTVGHIMERLGPWAVDEIAVDVIGLGAGVHNRLDELRREGKHHCQLVAVDVAERAPEIAHPAEARPFRLRDHLWLTAKQWLTEEEPVFCAPDRQACEDLAGELANVGFQPNSQGLIVVEPTDSIRKRLGCSPDIASGLLCTFATSRKRQAGTWGRH